MNFVSSCEVGAVQIYCRTDCEPWSKQRSFTQTPERALILLMTALNREQLEPLREALVRARLPVDDLDHPGRCFFTFSLQGIDMAFGGIEGEGADRLLRSLVVLDGHRGRGIGAAVLATLEAFAKREGVV